MDAAPTLVHLSRLRGPSLLVEVGAVRILTHPGEAWTFGGPGDRTGVRRDRLLAFDAVVGGTAEAVGKLRHQGEGRWMGVPAEQRAGGFRGGGGRIEWPFGSLSVDAGGTILVVGGVRFSLDGRTGRSVDAEVVVRDPAECGPGEPSCRYQIPVPHPGMPWRDERAALGETVGRLRWQPGAPRVVPLDRGERVGFRCESGQVWLASRGVFPRGLLDRWGMLGRFVGLRGA